MCSFETRKSKCYVARPNLLFSLIDQKKDQRKHQAYQNAGCNGKIYLKIALVDHDVAWQLSGERKLWGKLYNQSRKNQDGSRDY